MKLSDIQLKNIPTGIRMIKRKDQKYRKWLRSQPCSKCSNYRENYIAPAHQRILGGGGMGLKPHDKDLLPLCNIPGFECHRKEHGGAVTFWGLKDKLETKEYVQALCDKYIKKYEEK